MTVSSESAVQRAYLRPDLGADPNFSTLRGQDEYANYFNLLSLAFSMLSKSYNKQAPLSREAVEVTVFLERFLNTVNCLRLKYTYGSEDRRSLWVDLTESGFPNVADINQIAVDLERKDKILAELPSASTMTQAILEQLFVERKDPLALLAKQSSRSYHEQLTLFPPFLSFTPGTLRRAETKTANDNSRSYTYSWGCYDFATNRPYIHLISFEQDASQYSLEDDPQALDAFVRTIEQQGRRAPDVAVLAIGIDDALETIHPKILKRICLGPLYSRTLLTGSEPNIADAQELAIRRVFAENQSGNDSDFVLFISDEITFSKRQEISRSLLSPRGKIREIFAIQESDPECYQRRAAVVHHQALLPHHLLQQIPHAEQNRIPNFSKCRKITFDRNGDVYVF